MKNLLIILFLFPLLINAQTRFYLSTIAPNITPTVNAGWNVTTGFASNSLVSTGRGQTNANKTSAASGAASPLKILIGQYVSAPLTTQTLNCTITGQLRMDCTAATTGQGWVYLRLINADGTVASELGNATTTNLNTSGNVQNRTFTTITLTSVSITSGQRLCIELGWNYSSGTITTATATYGQQSNVVNSDLPVDNTTTTVALNPWFQFSQTLLFQSTGNFF